MTSEDMTWKRSYDNALDFIEENDALTTDDIKAMMADEETRELTGELLDVQQAFRMEHGLRKSDVNHQWEKFIASKDDSEKTSSEFSLDNSAPNNTETTHSNFFKRRPMIVGSIIGIAATLLALFVFSWAKSSFKRPLPEGAVVFEASDEPQRIMLKQGNDDAVSLEGDFQKALEHTPELAQNGTTLNYQQATNANKPSTIQLLTTPIGKDFSVTLSDGTKVYLNADSRLEYPSKFEGGTRTVKLDGEAFFEVAKDKTRPFIVQTDQLQTRVLGTKFNVSGFANRPPHVTLIEGRVEVSGRKSGQHILMQPGDDVTTDAEGKLCKKEVDIESYVSWQEGYFYFDNLPLVDIMQSLARWYNVNVVFANKNAMNYRFHFLCDRKGGIDQAIKLLNRMKRLNITREDNTVVVK